MSLKKKRKKKEKKKEIHVPLVVSVNFHDFVNQTLTHTYAWGDALNFSPFKPQQPLFHRIASSMCIVSKGPITADDSMTGDDQHDWIVGHCLSSSLGCLAISRSCRQSFVGNGGSKWRKLHQFQPYSGCERA